MQKILTTILLALSLISFGQNGKFNPFKLIVLKPDTAIIDKSLYSGRDSVEGGYLRRYYHAIEQLQQIADAKYRQDDTSFVRRQKEYKAEIVAAKAMEPEIKSLSIIRYFHPILRKFIIFISTSMNHFQKLLSCQIKQQTLFLYLN